MEVHHHPHVKKKRFKEYFLEFIMIFLAVTLGFFAETIRENVTEHRRAKEFAESMLQDLREDTAQLRSYREYSILRHGMSIPCNNSLLMPKSRISPQVNYTGMAYLAALIVILYPTTRRFNK